MLSLDLQDTTLTGSSEQAVLTARRFCSSNSAVPTNTQLFNSLPWSPVLRLFDIFCSGLDYHTCSQRDTCIVAGASTRIQMMESREVSNV